MKGKPPKGSRARVNRLSGRRRTSCRSAGACSGRRVGAAPGARGGAGCRVAESQVPAHELERWQRIFVEQGKRGLRTKAEPEERELILARAKIGELMMRLELAEDLIEKRGFTDEWKRRKDEQERSPGTGRRYPLTMICPIYRSPARRSMRPSPGRRGGRRGSVAPRPG